MFPNGFLLRKSDKNWRIRRKEILNTMSINNCSEYVGMILDSVDRKLINLVTKEK